MAPRASHARRGPRGVALRAARRDDDAIEKSIGAFVEARPFSGFVYRSNDSHTAHLLNAVVKYSQVLEPAVGGAIFAKALAYHSPRLKVEHIVFNPARDETLAEMEMFDFYIRAHQAKCVAFDHAVTANLAVWLPIPGVCSIVLTSLFPRSFHAYSILNTFTASRYTTPNTTLNATPPPTLVR